MGTDAVAGGATRTAPSRVVLHWIPVGAGGHVVRHTGRWYERLVALRDRRRPAALVHAAIEAWTSEGRIGLEMAPAWGPGSDAPGVVATGPVGCRVLGRSRFFRYEVRVGRGVHIPDLGYAVGAPYSVEGPADATRRLLGLAPQVPLLTWGRDEAGLGEMWNSNSLVAWLLVASGHAATRVPLPPGVRAPGWDAGIRLGGSDGGRRHDPGPHGW